MKLYKGQTTLQDLLNFDFILYRRRNASKNSLCMSWTRQHTNLMTYFLRSTQQLIPKTVLIIFSIDQISKLCWRNENTLGPENFFLPLYYRPGEARCADQIVSLICFFCDKPEISWRCCNCFAKLVSLFLLTVNKYSMSVLNCESLSA